MWLPSIKLNIMTYHISMGTFSNLENQEKNVFKGLAKELKQDRIRKNINKIYIESKTKLYCHTLTLF